MTWSFPIGKLFGSELRVHATFLILLLWIAVSAWLAGGPQAALVNVAFIVIIFACVVAHEFGHALMARRFGISTPDVTLLPIGGVARLERMPEKPAEEIAVALAGPAVNVVIWLVLTLFLGAQSQMSDLTNIDDPARSFLGRVASLNLFLVLFNMIPAFPMDGGRVFRALLAMWTGRVQATWIAARAGQLLAFVFGFVGLTTGNPILVLIGVFVFVAAASESSDVALQDIARHLLAREAMITQFESLSPDDSLQAAEAALIRTTQHEFPVLDNKGHIVGFVDRNAIFNALQKDGPPPRISEIMQPSQTAVPLTMPLNNALSMMDKAAAIGLAVTDLNGHVVGYITRENIGELMVIASRRREDLPRRERVL